MYVLNLCHIPRLLGICARLVSSPFPSPGCASTHRDPIHRITLRWSLLRFLPGTHRTMSQRRVCDACAVRRVRCDGLSPCARCTNADLDCTRVRPRLKSGPKGIKKRTLEKLAKEKGAQSCAQRLRPDDLRPLTEANNPAISWSHSPSDDANHVAGGIPNLEPHTIGSWPAFDHRDVAVDNAQFGHEPWDDIPAYPYRITVDHLLLYLDIYHHKLYPVWPIVNKDSLTTRLCAQTPDSEAYILASSVCIATILQLQLTASDLDGSLLRPEAIMEEIESLRRSQDYREHPSIDSLRSSFFLHVAHLHMRKQRTSTLTLREAISMAHMLDLHKPSHYETLSAEDARDHLRMLWLLFITER